MVVAELVMMCAERIEILDEGRSTLGPGCAVVAVGAGGRLAAVRCAAGFVAGSDVFAVFERGSTSDEAVVEQLSIGVIDVVAPGGFVLVVVGDLSGDVGDDGSPAGDEGWVVVEVHECGQL